MRKDHAWIVYIIMIICNCIIGCVSIFAIANLSIHFELWGIMFFMLVPLSVCTMKFTRTYSGEENKKGDE